MCELFGFSSRHISTVSVSLSAFMAQAGPRNPDGWGIGWYKGSVLNVQRDPAPVESGAMAHRFADTGVSTQLLISHLRKATIGPLTLGNTQPFTWIQDDREICFAFNGHVPDVFTASDPPRIRVPEGDTDAEFLFGLLIDRLYVQGTLDADTFAVELRAFGCWLAEMGPANFLLSDGDSLYAFASRRTHSDGMHPPGLHYAVRACVDALPDFGHSSVRVATPTFVDQQICLIASYPLSDEKWLPFGENELLCVRDGTPVRLDPDQ